MKRTTLGVLALAVLFALPASSQAQALNSSSSATAQNCTSVNLGTITWTFSATYTCGRYATGDFWVTNSGGSTVSINSITPAYTFVAADSSARNGSMLNPHASVNGFTQGFDSRYTDADNAQSTKGNAYSAGLNVGITMPLVITEGNSLLSSESYCTDCRPAQHQSFSKQIQVLTVLTGNAAVGDLRPPYQSAASKASPGNISTFNYDLFHDVTPPASWPYSTATLDAIMLEPQIELEISTKGRYLHAADNYNPKIGPVSDYGYGQNVGMAHGVLMLALNSNYTNAQKQPWLIHLVQAGIDLYGAMSTVTNTPPHGIMMIAGGSHNPGKIFSMSIAGTQLNNATIKAWGNNATHPNTNEKNQYFRITVADTQQQNNPVSSCAASNYTPSQAGLAEWGTDHVTDTLSDSNKWGGIGAGNNCYRSQVAQGTISQVLAAQMMHIQSDLQLDEMFEYYNQRFVPWAAANMGITNQIFQWQLDFWNAYNGIGAPTGGSPPTNTAPTLTLTSTSPAETTATTTTLTAGYADSDGSVSSVTWARTVPSAASGSCSLAGGIATCPAVGVVAASVNDYILTATDNGGLTATAQATVLRRTCPATPEDTFTVDGVWATPGPCYTRMTTSVLGISGNQAAATATTARHLSLMAWSGGAPDDYKVQVTSTSNVTEASFLLIGCMATTSATDVYNGYVVSMQGNGTNIGKYTAGVRSSLAGNTQPADGGWVSGETVTAECEDTGSSTVITAKDQNGVVITTATDTVNRYSSGDPFVGAWGGATFDNFMASSIVGGPGPDTTPPTITVTLPVSDPASTSSLVYSTFAGTTTDNVAVTSGTWTNLTNADAGTLVTSNSYATWTVPVGQDLDLNADSANIIEFRVCDAAANCNTTQRTINHVTGVSVTAAFTKPGVARPEPYVFKGDQIQLRGVCSAADHVEIWINGAEVSVGGVAASATYISGTTSWQTIRPIPIGLDPSSTRQIEARCVQGDASYASTIIYMTQQRLPYR